MSIGAIFGVILLVICISTTIIVVVFDLIDSNKTQPVNNVPEEFVPEEIDKSNAIQNTVQAIDEVANDLYEYKSLLDMDAITQEEFEAKKKELLDL